MHHFTACREHPGTESPRSQAPRGTRLLTPERLRAPGSQAGPWARTRSLQTCEENRTGGDPVSLSGGCCPQPLEKGEDRFPHPTRLPGPAGPDL